MAKIKEEQIEQVPNIEALEGEDLSKAFSSVYGKTISGLDKIIDNKFYPDILESLRSGNATIELRKRAMLRAIDEVWINAIEDVLPSIELIIRAPRKYIVEEEYVLPISQSKGIVPRSVRHLAQHVDYISKIEGDKVTPNKILNVFREETILTYENKFINTLIKRLYIFVGRRYDQAAKHPLDSISTTLSYKNEFTHGEMQGKINFQIELLEPANNFNVENNYTYSSKLWHRVENLHDVCLGFMRSDFCKQVGEAVVKPPIIHTNALMKNQNFKKCLALWEFIESYDNAGYTLLIDEHLESMDEEYIKELYHTIAVQYLIFRDKLHGGFEEDKTLAKSEELTKYTPEIVEDLKPTVKNEFDGHYGKTIPMEPKDKELTELDHKMLEAIDQTIKEAEKYQKALDLAALSSVQRSFLSRLIQGTESLQDAYNAVKNRLLMYVGVKARTSWTGESFSIGRKKYASMAIKGKSLVVYLALDPYAYEPEKYHQKDAGGKGSKNEKTPFEMKISSDKQLKGVLYLVDEALKEVEKYPDFKEVDYKMPYEPDNQLFEEGLIKVTEGENKPEYKPFENNDEITFTQTAEAMFEEHHKRSFQSKLIQSEKTIQEQYGELKNAILSYTKVKGRISFTKETFTLGREKIANLQFKGKKIAVGLSLNPEKYDKSKYHHKATTNADFPTIMPVTSNRSMKYALELISDLMTEKNIPFNKQENVDYTVPYQTDEQLISLGLIKVDTKDRSIQKKSSMYDVIPELDYSYVASMTLADDDYITFYRDVKNQLLMGAGVRSKIGKYYETFTKGRDVIARLSVKDGMFYCFLGLNADEVNEFVCHYKLFEDVAYLKNTPVAVDIASATNVKNLNKLISTTLFSKYSITLDPTFEYEEFSFEKKSFEKLFDEGLIKGEMPKFEEIKPLVGFKTEESDKAEADIRKNEPQNELPTTSIESQEEDFTPNSIIEESDEIVLDGDQKEIQYDDAEYVDLDNFPEISEMLDENKEKSNQDSLSSEKVLMDVSMDSTPEFELESDDEKTENIDLKSYAENDDVEFVQQELPVGFDVEEDNNEKKKAKNTLQKFLRDKFKKK